MEGKSSQLDDPRIEIRELNFEIGERLSLEQNAVTMCNMDWNQSEVSFLFTDLDVAMTFMDVADTSDLEETARRNHAHARTAYNAVLRLSNKLILNADQRPAIDAKLSLLKTRLQAVGQQF
jgi:hypothetical protein